MKDFPPTPELNRMAELSKQHNSQDVGAFLDWLQGEAGCTICEWAEPEWDPMTRDYCSAGAYFPARRSINQWLHEWLDVDADKCEAERRAILEHIQKSANPETQ